MSIDYKKLIIEFAENMKEKDCEFIYNSTINYVPDSGRVPMDRYDHIAKRRDIQRRYLEMKLKPLTMNMKV